MLVLTAFRQVHVDHKPYTSTESTSHIVKYHRFSAIPTCESMSEPIPRFASQASTAEDLLKSHTVGLVHLSDFRKRRAEALEQKEREASDKHGGFGRFKLASTNSSTGTATPDSTGHDG